MPARFARPRSLALWVALAFAASLGCREGPTAPPSGLPSGLPVTLSVKGAFPPFTSPTVQAAGDSVVATYVSGSRCDDYHADAGLRGGMMVITVTDNVPPVQVCLLTASSAVYRVVVHGAQSGRYLVVVATREVQPDGKSDPSSTIVGQVVTLP
jgi:hypothetical protein